MEFRELDAADVQPLRTRVLRTFFSDGELEEFEGDEARSSRHYGLVDGEGRIVAVASYLPESAPEGLGEPAMRLRGMAVEEDLRGEGHGSRLLQSSLSRLALERPELAVVWCHARTSAAGFYEREGFRRKGEVFEVERIGPHVVMWREMPEVLADGEVVDV